MSRNKDKILEVLKNGEWTRKMSAPTADYLARVGQNWVRLGACDDYRVL